MKCVVSVLCRVALWRHDEATFSMPAVDRPKLLRENHSNKIPLTRSRVVHVSILGNTKDGVYDISLAGLVVFDCLDGGRFATVSITPTISVTAFAAEYVRTLMSKPWRLVDNAYLDCVLKKQVWFQM
jgi:hypothetical protein